MDFKVWKKEFTVAPNGFANTGVICYFNALLQGFLGCTSMTELILGMTEAEVKDSNQLVKTYRDMLKNLDGKGIEQWSTKVWDAFIAELKKQGKKDSFGTGQEDSHEGLVLFVDAFKMPALDQLFMHRYMSTIYCDLCLRTCSQRVDEGIAIELHVKELNEKTDCVTYIKRHVPDIDNNYKCPHCHMTGGKRQVRTLRLAPEIIMLQFKKYDSKWNVEFPREFELGGGEMIHKYKLVAQTEHAGGVGGGHYWARGLRKDDKVYTLNDMQVSPSGWQSTANTYLVWYHMYYTTKPVAKK